MRVWVVGYREQAIPTLIRGANDAIVAPVEGALWVEPKSGAVLRGTLRHGGALEHTDIRVEYRRDEGLQLLVPAEMHVRIELGAAKPFVEGTARYGECRRFETKVRFVGATPPK